MKDEEAGSCNTCTNYHTWKKCKLIEEKVELLAKLEDDMIRYKKGNCGL